MNEFDPMSHSHAQDESAPVATAVRERPSKRRLMSRKKVGVIVAAGLTCAAAGLATAGTSSAATLSSDAATPTDTVTATPTTPVGGGPVTTPEPGGSTGIVD